MEDKEPLLNRRYVLTRRLSKGGMGIVFEGFDTLLSAPVAIKKSIFEEEILRRAFEREAQLLANLSHRSLPYCVDFFTSDQHQYLVMKFIEGRTAEELLSESPRGLAIEFVKDLARQLLDVVEYLHSQLVLHRDIKTSNIKIKDGCLYLLDLGVAYGQIGEMNTVVSGDLGFACHSAHYSPPEQLENQCPSPAGDLYSLAATLYKLITGKAPEDALSRLTHNEELTRPMVDSDSQDFVSGIMRALSLDRKARPQNVAEMRQLMFPDKPSPVVVNIPVPASRSKRPRLMAAVVAVGLFSLLAVFLWKGRHTELVPAPAPQKQEITDLNRVHFRIREGARVAIEAQAWLEQGNDQKAKNKATEAIGFDPDNTMARRVLGEVAKNVTRDEGGFKSPSSEAQDQAKMILQVFSNRDERELSTSERTDLAWARFQLAEHTDDLALLDNAIATANEVLRLEPNKVPALMLLFEASYERHSRVENPNDLKSLISKIDSVLKARPSYAYGYVVRGNFYAALADFKHARSSYNSAAKLTPRAATYYLVASAILGIEERTEEDLASACKYATLSLEKNPNYYPARTFFNEVCSETDAAESYRRRARTDD